MIEFIERHHHDGSMSARLFSPDLPRGMYYHVHLWHDGRCTAKSRGWGKGGVRYYDHASYEAALAHGYQWGKRKIAEGRKIIREDSRAIDQAAYSLRQQLLAQ